MTSRYEFTKELGAILALGLLLLPAAFAAHPAEVITGHTVFVRVDDYDPCLAGIAGISRLRVMWFNDVPLYERTSVEAGNYVYAVEKGAPDPRDRKIVPSGTVYEFKDPNGHWWKIEEGYFDLESNPSLNQDNNLGVQGGSLSGAANVSAHLHRYYVWTVEIKAGPPLANDNMGDHVEAAFYNFVTLVNTCKFSPGARPSGVAEHNPADPDAQTFDGEHETGYDTHSHEKWLVDLYIGRVPDWLPVSFEPSPDGAWIRIGAGGQADHGTTDSRRS